MAKPLKTGKRYIAVTSFPHMGNYIITLCDCLPVVVVLVKATSADWGVVRCCLCFLVAPGFVTFPPPLMASAIFFVTLAMSTRSLRSSSVTRGHICSKCYQPHTPVWNLYPAATRAVLVPKVIIFPYFVFRACPIFRLPLRTAFRRLGHL